MAETVLSAVNRVLQDAGIITTALTTLTGAAQQMDVQAAVDGLNEVIDELSDLGGYPSTVGSSTITLATGTRSYSAATDFVSIYDDTMMDLTTGYRIFRYPGGFDALRATQLIPANNTGTPVFWTIDPTTGQFYLNMIPTAVENGRIYTYLYNKETNFLASSPASTFPYTDETIRRMVPAIVECLRRRRIGKFDQTTYKKSLARSARTLSRQKPRTHYGPGDGPEDGTDALWRVW